METVKFMHKFTNQTLPKYFPAYFRRVPATHNRRTRSSTSDKLNLPLFKTNREQTSIKYQGPKVWNSIPTPNQCLKFKKISLKYHDQLLATYEN